MNRLLCLALKTGILDDALYGPEILLNGGFESLGGSFIWLNWVRDAGSGAVADTSTAYLGTHAAKVTAGATANSYIYQGFTVVPGLRYTVSFYTRGDGSNAGRYRLLDVSNSVYVINYTSTLITGTDYTKVSFSFTAPDGCISARLYLFCSAADTGVVYYDEVSAKRNL